MSYAFQVSGHPKCVKYDQFHAGNRSFTKDMTSKPDNLGPVAERTKQNGKMRFNQNIMLNFMAL